MASQVGIHGTGDGLEVLMAVLVEYFSCRFSSIVKFRNFKFLLKLSTSIEAVKLLTPALYFKGCMQYLFTIEFLLSF